MAKHFMAPARKSDQSLLTFIQKHKTTVAGNISSTVGWEATAKLRHPNSVPHPLIFHS